MQESGQSRATLRRDVGDAVPYTPCHCEERSDAAIRFPFLGRIPTPVCGGAHGPRPTGRSGHAGRTESPVVMEYLPVPGR